MKNIYAVIIIVLLVSCSDRIKEKNRIVTDEPLVEINISNELINKEIDYTNLIDSIEVIKLETNGNSLIGSIRKIEFHDDKFYVSTDTQILLIFGRNGNYINKLSKKGKGPGEYLEMRDFSVDKDGSIKILSFNTILTYDLNLKYISQKTINVTSHTGREINPIHFLPIGDFTFLYTGSFALKNLLPGNDYALYCINSKNKIVGEYFPLLSTETSGHQNFYRSNDLINLTNTYGNDTIYQILDDYVVPKVFVNFLDDRITANDMMDDRAVLYNTISDNGLCGNVMKVYENSNYLCFKFTKGRYPKQSVYNKETQEIKVINIVNSLPFPKIITEGLIDNSFFTTIDPYVLLQETNGKNYSDFLNTFNLTSMKETDNPIIVKFKFKF